MKSWRISTAIALCTASLVLGSCNGNGGDNAAQIEAITEDWVAYTPEDQSYSVKFPGEPQGDQFFAGYEGESISYGVIAIPYPPEQGSPDDLIEELTATLTQEGGTIENQEDITRNDLPGRELTVVTENSRLKVLVLFDEENGRIYQVLAGSDDTEQDIEVPEVNAFLSSFEVADAPIAVTPSPEDETRNNLGALSRAQQAYFLEESEFAPTIDDLGLGINPETENFNYAIDTVEGDRVYMTATAKNADTKSFGALVFVDESSDQGITQGILCATDEPAQTPPDIPQVTDGQPECASGSSAVE